MTLLLRLCALTYNAACQLAVYCISSVLFLSLALLDAIVISTNDFVTLSEVEGLCVIPRVSFSIYGVK